MNIAAGSCVAEGIATAAGVPWPSPPPSAPPTSPPPGVLACATWSESRSLLEMPSNRPPVSPCSLAMSLGRPPASIMPRASCVRAPAGGTVSSPPVSSRPGGSTMGLGAVAISVVGGSCGSFFTLGRLALGVGAGALMKYTWLSACSAVMRLLGLGTSMRDSRSSASASTCGKCVDRGSGVTAVNSMYVGSEVTSGHVSSVGVPTIMNIFPSWSRSLDPGKSGRRRSIWPKTQPIAHTSTAAPYDFDPKRSSGARNQRAKTWSVYARSGEPKARARPKSPNLRVPSGAMSRLSNLMSRCSTQCLCVYASARRAICMYALTSAGFRAIRRSFMTFSMSLSMKSNTRCRLRLCG
mmetsp:Transcript_10716/g.44283  ORF Transcript_10716/g.44283 Transcript_10716/m.44283 type:complete len:352 (-) Transcript_10716:435-1490(-)